jgi:hypothetical protein
MNERITAKFKAVQAHPCPHTLPSLPVLAYQTDRPIPVAPLTDHHFGGGLGDAPRPPAGVWGQAPPSLGFFPTRT